MHSYKRIYIISSKSGELKSFPMFARFEMIGNKKRGNHLPLFNVYTNQNLAQASISMSLFQKSSILA